MLSADHLELLLAQEAHFWVSMIYSCYKTAQLYAEISVVGTSIVSASKEGFV